MINFVHDGHRLEIIAPYEVMSGDGVLRGDLFGIATSWAGEGEVVTVSTSGVFDLRRLPDEHWEVGDPIYWNDATKAFTRNPRTAVKIGVAVAPTRGAEHPWVRGKLLGFAA